MNDSNISKLGIVLHVHSIHGFTTSFSDSVVQVTSSRNIHHTSMCLFNKDGQKFKHYFSAPMKAGLDAIFGTPWI